MSVLAGRWVGRLGVTAFVIAALSLGRVIGDELPQPFDTFTQPRDHAVAVGEVAALRTADVSVTDVQVGTHVLDSSTPLPTPGLWLVIELELTPRLADAAPSTWSVVSTDGRQWGRTRPLLATCRSTPPGITQRCGLVVEVLPEALPGASLQLATELDTRYDDRAVIDLGLDEAAVDAALAAGADPLVVPEFEMWGTP